MCAHILFYFSFFKNFINKLNFNKKLNSKQIFFHLFIITKILTCANLLEYSC